MHAESCMIVSLYCYETAIYPRIIKIGDIVVTLYRIKLAKDV